MPIVFCAEALRSAGFVHAFSTRAASVGDVAAAIGVLPSALRRSKQMHSARVIDVKEDPTESIEADALVSRSSFAVAVQTADCVPILVGDRSTGAVAAIHAGWRGTASGIVRNAIERLGGGPENLVVAIGPCIGSCCFEVGSDVAEKIVSASDASVVDRRAGEKAFVDLRRAVRWQLTQCGISQGRIEDVAYCTYCEKELFFSYRRDGANAGRLISAVRPH